MAYGFFPERRGISFQGGVQHIVGARLECFRQVQDVMPELWQYTIG